MEDEFSITDNDLIIDGYDNTTCEEVILSNNISSEKLKNETINQAPWIEKYRPKKINDIILNQSILSRIKKIIHEKDMPNIIITGIPGIGKTTTMKCIARAIYGKYVNEMVLEINASDERGIRTVYDPIKNFCQKAIDHSKFGTDNIKKLIILDEADNITDKAQHSINKKMEEFNSTTRFAFTCNNSVDIIEAIQSKCIIIRYTRIPKNEVINRLKYVCEKENVTYNMDALDEIALISQGDLRSALNNLQAVYNGLNEVNIQNVYTICDKPQPLLLIQILYFCKNCDIKNAFNSMINLKENGYSESDIIFGLLNVLKYECKLDSSNSILEENEKIHIMKKIATTSYIISKGIASNLQLFGLLSSIILDFKYKKILI